MRKKKGLQLNRPERVATVHTHTLQWRSRRRKRSAEIYYHNNNNNNKYNESRARVNRVVHPSSARSLSKKKIGKGSRIISTIDW